MYSPDSLMISISGVRGILGEGMNPEAAARFAAAYADWLAGSLVVVGRDTRASGPTLSSAVCSALRFKGVDIIDIGIAATPTVEIMVSALGADGGIIITASHNDERWNALKFLGRSGEFIDAGAIGRIRESVEKGGILYGPPQRTGGYRTDHSADGIHIEKITALDRIDPERIAARRFKAAVDCVNGAGSRIVPALLERLGVETVEIFTDTEAPFPRDPEPRPKNLSDLSEAVVESGADIGFACDPDADRLVLVDHMGNVLSEELTVSLASDFVLKEEKGPVAVNLSTTRLIDDIAAIHGVRVHRSKVGEANVTQMMKETGAVIGGEGNGGVIYPPVHYGRDAMTGIALILQLLAEEEAALAEKAASLPSYAIVKEKTPFSGDLEGAALALEKEFEGEFNGLDGIRIDMETGWVHMRRSNTEPVVRIIAEAGSGEEALLLVERAAAILKAHDGKDEGTAGGGASPGV